MKKKEERQATPEMLAYIEADLQEKKAKLIKEQLKPVIVQQYKEGKCKFTNLDHRTQTSNPIDSEKLYHWVARTWPEKVNLLKVDLICPIKFQRAYALGEIEYDSLPEEVYTEKIVEVLTVKVKNET